MALDWHLLVTLAVLLGAVALFVTEALRADLVALLALAVLLLTGVVSPAEGLSGFSNVATLTVAAVFVLSAGLYRTGAVALVARPLERLGRRSVPLLTALLMLMVGAISAFVNNTAAVAVFLPVALGLANRARVSPSKLLMPLSFASMFGGVCTLIGTSTNILVSSIATQHGLAPIGMFELAPLGLLTFAVGVVFMLAVGVRLIPDRRPAGDLVDSFQVGDYVTEIVLLAASPSVGLTLAEAPLVREHDLDVLAIQRNDDPAFVPRGWTRLRAGDLLRVRCSLAELRAVEQRGDIELKPGSKWRGEDPAAELILVDAVVAPGSRLVGKSLEDVGFRQLYDATVLAIRHRGHLLSSRLSETRLRAGDLLLLEVSRHRLPALRQSAEFVLVSETGVADYRRRKMLPALAVLTAVILTAALGWVPIVIGAVVGAVLMVLLGCLDLEEAYTAIQWRVVFLLAGILSVAVALEKTGGATLAAEAMVKVVGDLGPVAVLAAFYLLTSLLTEAMSNNATAALLAPVAIATAASLEVDPRPFLIAVTFAASSSFMTPVGYQTNTLIFGPGHYRFMDFVRVGAPLNLLFWLLATLLIPWFWPF